MNIKLPISAILFCSLLSLGTLGCRTPLPEPDARSSDAQLLFSSGFEGDIAIMPPKACWKTGCWQEIHGRDAVTGFGWPPRLHNGDGKFLMLTDPVSVTAETLHQYMVNRVDTAIGPNGTDSKVLFQQISQNINGAAPMGAAPTQNEFQFLPKTDIRELYLSYWLKLQPDLVTRMSGLAKGPGVDQGGTWRAIFAFKTGGQTAAGEPADNGDYRVEAYVETYGGKAPYWTVIADNNAGGKAPLVNNWSVVNRSVPVPIDKWFKLEVLWRRSNGDDGRVWMAVDGQTIADRRGPNMGAHNMPINRIIAPLLYAGSSMPIYQWVDDLEIWNGLPPSRTNLK